MTGGLPVRLVLEQNSEFEVSVQRLATFPASLRQGYASEVMQELCRLADRHDAVLSLEAHPHPEEQDDLDDDMELKDLVSFYAKFGFGGEVRPGEDSAWMSREPGRSHALRRSA
ncbi:GNAT family N-acetyltransferase [Agrobacterium rubi]|nr:GNAT family N-acetyltransferase [Agrobacterium rubi]NTF23871.1 GNAT family N-acetyltransferase [Agrobacterium rubi]